MFSITYVAPYSGATRTQYFHSKEQALSMIEFYNSCGTKAYLN